MEIVFLASGWRKSFQMESRTDAWPNYPNADIYPLEHAMERNNFGTAASLPYPPFPLAP